MKSPKNCRLQKGSSPQWSRDMEMLLELSREVAATFTTDEMLRIIVNKLAGRMGVLRCSIIRLFEEDGSGLILASSDAIDDGRVRINLDLYPEIREVIRTGQPLVVEDAKQNPLMTEVRHFIAGLDFNTILVLPVISDAEVIGVLVLCSDRKSSLFSSEDIHFCTLMTDVFSGALKKAYHYEKICQETDELRLVKARLEHELQEKAVYETLFDHSSEGLIAMNVWGKPVYINSSALEMLGYNRDEALALSLADFVAEESFHDAMENHMNIFLGKEYRKKLDLTLMTKIGERKCASVSVSDHRLKGELVIIAFNDVTEDRRFQQELKRANERLHGLDQLKSEFISTATHELRVPVTVMHSYCSLIKEMGDENLTALQREYLDSAIAASERLGRLIGDMLDLAKLDAGKDQMNFSDQNILEPIYEVVSVLAPYAGASGLKVSIEPVQEDLVACFDNEQIRCVLTNLIGNAIKHTPGGGNIRVSVARSDDEVLVSVTDSGEGIPESYQTKIFDEFCQVMPKRDSKNGSGLGLAICKRIVSAHSGKLWVNSSPQQGSCFTFSLPAARN